MGKYRILRFKGFTQSSSLSVLQNDRGWHCSSCQYVGKDRNHLKNHILKRHRHEKKTDDVKKNFRIANLESS